MSDTAIDGLPGVSPTRERVDEFLEYTDLAPDHSLGAIPPKFGEATVEKLAINAVIAGCQPRYFPLILAAVEGMLHDEEALHNILTTTFPGWPVVMINGPVVEELEVNYGRNALGPGFQSNATIGRAITLICMNVGGAVPGDTDEATYGGPHKYGLCWAENEKRNPWTPLHVERGFDESTSTVTVFGAEVGPRQINDHISTDSASILSTCAKTMATVGTNMMYLSRLGEPHLSLCPEHADMLAADGWDKIDIKRYIYDQARVPKSEWEGRGLHRPDPGDVAASWPKHFDVGHPDGRIGMCPTPEDVIVTVTGGEGRHSFFFPDFSQWQTETVPITLEDGTAVESVEEFRSA
jgi:hypothetical protein